MQMSLLSSLFAFVSPTIREDKEKVMQSDRDLRAKSRQKGKKKSGRRRSAKNRSLERELRKLWGCFKAFSKRASIWNQTKDEVERVLSEAACLHVVDKRASFYQFFSRFLSKYIFSLLSQHVNTRKRVEVWSRLCRSLETEKKKRIKSVLLSKTRNVFCVPSRPRSVSLWDGKTQRAWMVYGRARYRRFLCVVLSGWRACGGLWLCETAMIMITDLCRAWVRCLLRLSVSNNFSWIFNGETTEISNPTRLIQICVTSTRLDSGTEASNLRMSDPSPRSTREQTSFISRSNSHTHRRLPRAFFDSDYPVAQAQASPGIKAWEHMWNICLEEAHRR